jgi:hypothetical protein
MILFVALFILGGIYRLLSNRYNPTRRKQKNKDIIPSTDDIEKEFDDDPIINPGFSFSKLNFFNKDRNDDGD